MFKGITQYPLAFMILSSIFMITLLTMSSIKSIIDLAHELNSLNYNTMDNDGINVNYEIINGTLYLKIPYPYSNGEYYAIYYDPLADLRVVELLNTTVVGRNEYVLVGPINTSYEEIIIVHNYHRPSVVDILVKNKLNEKHLSIYELSINSNIPPSLYLNLVIGDLSIVKSLNGRYRYIEVTPMVNPYKESIIFRGMTYVFNETYDLIPVNKVPDNITLYVTMYNVSWNNSRTYLYDVALPVIELEKYGRLKYISNTSIYSYSKYYAPYSKPWYYNSIEPNYYFYIIERRLIGDLFLNRTNSYNKLFFNITHSINLLDIRGVNTSSNYRAFIDITYYVIIYVGKNEYLYNYTESIAISTPAVNVLNKTIEFDVELPFNISDLVYIESYIEYDVYITNPTNEDLNVTMKTSIHGNYPNNCTVKVFSSGAVKIIDNNAVKEFLLRVYNESGVNIIENYTIEILRDLYSDYITLSVYMNNTLIYNTKSSQISLMFYGLVNVINTTLIVPDSLIQQDYIIDNITADKCLIYFIDNYIGLYFGDNNVSQINYVVPGIISISNSKLYLYNYSILIIDSWNKSLYIYTNEGNEKVLAFNTSTDINFIQNILVYNDIFFNEPLITFNNIPLIITLNITYIDGTYDVIVINLCTTNRLELENKPVSKIKIYINTNISDLDLYITLSNEWLLVYNNKVIITGSGYFDQNINAVVSSLGMYYVFKDNGSILIIPFSVSVNPLHYLKE